MKILVAVTGLLIAGTAVAGPCKEAERGTYLSNVCFLVETFSIRTEIAKADEDQCTATLTKPHSGLAGKTIHFDRVDLRQAEMYHISPRVTCWRLRGKGVSGTGPGSDVAAICGGRMDLFRLRTAFRNLYLKYCKSKTSEF